MQTTTTSSRNGRTTAEIRPMSEDSIQSSQLTPHGDGKHSRETKENAMGDNDSSIEVNGPGGIGATHARP